MDVISVAVEVVIAFLLGVLVAAWIIGAIASGGGHGGVRHE